MKKVLFTLAFAIVSVAAMAQTPTLKHSVATNPFWSNWFIQGGAQWTAFYPSAGLHLGNTESPFKSWRANPQASVAIGKWFTPEIGLRTKVSGIWGKALDTSFKYWNAQEQVLFDLSNLFAGYNPNRVWHPIVFGGAGLARNMSTNYYAMGVSLGLLNEFQVSKRVAVNVELGWNRFENDFVSLGMVNNDQRGWDSHDNYLYAELGLTLNLGRVGWNAVPDVDAINALHQSELDALNARLRDALSDNDRLKNLLANQKPAPVVETPAPVKEFITTPVSVFFDINKTNVASQYDLVNVKAVAKYAINNNSNLLVKGYADSATGTPERNQVLSEGRAETVKGHLVEMGVPAEKISTEGCGGVDDMSPIQFNRRDTVQVVE